MILPIVEYGDVFIASTTLETRKKFQKLQNKGLKMALGKDRKFNTKQVHSEAKLQKLAWRRKHLGQLMFHATKQTSFHNWGKSRHAMKTRSSEKKLIKAKKPKTENF